MMSARATMWQRLERLEGRCQRVGGDTRAAEGVVSALLDALGEGDSGARVGLVAVLAPRMSAGAAFDATADVLRMVGGVANRWRVVVGARVDGATPAVYLYPENGRGPGRAEAA